MLKWASLACGAFLTVCSVGHVTYQPPTLSTFSVKVSLPRFLVPATTDGSRENAVLLSHRCCRTAWIGLQLLSCSSRRQPAHELATHYAPWPLESLRLCCLFRRLPRWLGYRGTKPVRLPRFVSLWPLSSPDSSAAFFHRPKRSDEAQYC